MQEACVGFRYGKNRVDKLSSYNKDFKYPNLFALDESRINLCLLFVFPHKPAYFIFKTAREQVNAGQVN